MTNSLLADLNVLKEATPIKFVGGKYKAQQGWIDPNRKVSHGRTAVIVNDPTKGGPYQTVVETGNCRKLNTDQPMSLAEAVFLVPDVEAKIVDLCRTLAKFGILEDDEAIDEVKELFGVELKLANKWQNDKGDRAVWRRVKSFEAALEKAAQEEAQKVYDT